MSEFNLEKGSSFNLSKEAPMSKKSNEEKIQILQKRLQEISQKQLEQANSKVEPSEKENIIDEKVKKNPKKTRKFLFPILILTIIILSFLLATELGLNPIKKLQLNTTKIVKESNNSENSDQKKIKQTTNYNLDIQDASIILIGDFNSEESAIQETDRLRAVFGTVKDFDINYFFTPEKSDVKDSTYQIYLGPFSEESDAKQWSQFIKKDFKIIKF